MSKQYRGVPAIDRVMLRSVAGPGSCILFVGARLESGYGQVWDGGRGRPAHRIVLEDHLGRTLSPAEMADHLCGVRNCVNKMHLRATDARGNAENRINTPLGVSGFRGVSRDGTGRRWVARVMSGGVSHFLGIYDTAEAAAEAAVEGRKQHHATARA